MTEREFINIFEQNKEKFLSQNLLGEKNRKVLDLFEKWLKGKSVVVRTGNNEKKCERKNIKINLGSYFDEITSVARDILIEKGIQVSCISLGRTIGIKETSKCIRVFKGSNIYYRIGRTIPRKGKYSGQDLIAMELVMDGNKKRVFMPMLEQREYIEKRLGFEVERELEQLEATGKYRFKLFFPFDDEGEGVYDAKELGQIFADFIFITRDCLRQLNVK